MGQYIYRAAIRHPCRLPAAVGDGDLWVCECGKAWISYVTRTFTNGEERFGWQHLTFSYSHEAEREYLDNHIGAVRRGSDGTVFVAVQDAILRAERRAE